MSYSDLLFSYLINESLHIDLLIHTLFGTVIRAGEAARQNLVSQGLFYDEWLQCGTLSFI